MGLFSDIYNTVAKFFRQQDGISEGDASKSVATNRLKLVLMQDRTNLTPKILEQMRGELVDLLSKYLEMDKELLELNFEQDGEQVALMLSIPVIRAKDEDEIEQALSEKDSDEESEKEDEADVSENDSEEYEDNSDNEEELNSEENQNETDCTDDIESEPSGESSSEEENSDKPKKRSKKNSEPENVQEESLETI